MRPAAVKSPAGGASPARSVTFMGDSKLAAGGKGEPVTPWNLASGEVAVTFPKAPRFVAASPDGRGLATATPEEDILLRSIEVIFIIPAIVHALSDIPPPSLAIQLWDVAGDKAPLSVVADSVAFSPDGKTLAVVDRKKGVTFWDVASPAGAWTGLPGACRAFSPDGKTLAVADWNIVTLWDVAGRRKTATFRLDGGQIYKRMAFGPDGKTLAVVGDHVTLWSAKGSRKIATLQKDSSFLEDAAFSPDGKTLAVVDWKGVTLWDVASRPITATLRLDRGQFSERVAFGPDGKTLAVVDPKGVTLWDVADRPITATLRLDHPVSCVVFSPDGQTLAVAEFNEGAVTLWDVANRRKTATLQPNHVPSCLVFSPDGKTLALGGFGGMVTLWDVATRQRTAAFWTGSFPCPMAFSPDGRTLRVGGVGSVRLWDTAGGKKAIPFASDGFSSGRPAFSPDGKTLATVRVLQRGRARWSFGTWPAARKISPLLSRWMAAWKRLSVPTVRLWLCWHTTVSSPCGTWPAARKPPPSGWAMPFRA